jgi:hypothetical protein
MSRMSRMRKILLSAPGSSRQRPNEPRGTAARDATIRESCPLFQAPWAGTRAAAAIIFCILPILPIPSKQFPQSSWIGRSGRPQRTVIRGREVAEERAFRWR